MPLFRYFAVTGVTLLGLLVLVDWLFPTPAAAVAENNVDRSRIRIHSSHKWPEAIQITQGRLAP